LEWFVQRRKILCYVFHHNIHPAKGEYGIRVGKRENNIRFNDNGILDNFLLGAILKTQMVMNSMEGLQKK
jgi:hypothetical protein